MGLGLGLGLVLGPPVPLAPVLVLGLGGLGAAYRFRVCWDRFRGLGRLGLGGVIVVMFNGVDVVALERVLLRPGVHLLHAKTKPPALGLWAGGLL